MNDNSTLNRAAANKKDEFYTLLPVIEKEMSYYSDYFAGKTIYCNCDDPFESNFVKYFAMHFNSLHLKRLISVSFAGSPIARTELRCYETKGGQVRCSGTGRRNFPPHDR